MHLTLSGRPSATLEASAAASAPAPRQQRAQHRGVDASHPQTKRQTTRRSCAASARCSRRPLAAKNGNGLAGAAGSARCCSIAALLSRLCTPPSRQSQAARCATAQPAQHSSRTMGRSARASAARQDLVHHVRTWCFESGAVLRAGCTQPKYKYRLEDTEKIHFSLSGATARPDLRITRVQNSL